MNEISAAVGSFVRNAIQAGGAGLVTSGYLSDSDLTMAAGIGASIVALAWSIIRNRLLKKKLAGA